MRLKERVAIVTGGARGIGEAIARCLADEGALVAVLDIDEGEALRAAGELGAQHLGMGADVSNEGTAAAYLPVKLAATNSPVGFRKT